MAAGGEDRLTRAIEAREVAPRAWKVALPELIEQEGVEAPVPGVDGLHDDARRQLWQDLVRRHAPQAEVILALARRVQLLRPLRSGRDFSGQHHEPPSLSTTPSLLDSGTPMRPRRQHGRN